MNTTVTYNGMTLKQISENFPVNMPEVHRELYIRNCIEVFHYEKQKVNLGLCECIRNSNFNLIEYYLNN